MTSYAADYKPDFDKCMQRVDAWFSNEIIDRVPVRFKAHNAEFSIAHEVTRWNSVCEMWFDVDFQLNCFEESLEKSSFLGETFPVYWPNLGPNVYAAFLGAELLFSDITSWAKPFITQNSDDNSINFSSQNKYYKKIQELTKCALERAKGKYYVGYTDIHGGLDCLDAMMGTQELLIAMLDSPENILRLTKRVNSFFDIIYTGFAKQLLDSGQPSVNWMNIPTRELMHVPSCDLSSMMSPSLFCEFAEEAIVQEMTFASKNIFHLDGKDVARHIDSILEMDAVDAIQWVQGVGNDSAIMQWIPLIKKIQSAGKGIVVDLKISELDDFILNMKPNGIYLCIDSTQKEEQQYAINKLEKWR